MSRPGFTAMVKVDETGGGIELLNEDRFLELSRRLKPGLYKLTVEKHVANRTHDQNAYLHAGPFPVLMKELCYDSMEELKRDLMGTCWGWVRSPLGHEVPVKAHTSDMDVEECSFFIDWLIPWAVKQGIAVPLPKDREELKRSA